MTLKTVKINNEQVLPFKSTVKADTRPVKGYNLFPECICQVTLVAKKKSGKTVVIQKIIKECGDKNTKVYAFCSTVNKDTAWLNIQAWCKKHGRPFQGFLSIYDGKINLIESMMDHLNSKIEPGNEPDEEYSSSENEYFERYDSVSEHGESDVSEDDMFGDMSLMEKKLFNTLGRMDKESKQAKYQAPEYIIIFDDLIHELKDPAIVRLMTMHRHYKAMVISSCQFINAMLPSQLKQQDYMLLFKSLTPEKIKKVEQDGDLAVSYDKLQELYDDATREPFSFLYIDVRGDTYRKKFDREYELGDIHVPKHTSVQIEDKEEKPIKKPKTKESKKTKSEIKEMMRKMGKEKYATYK